MIEGGPLTGPPPPFTIKNVNLFKKVYFLIVLFFLPNTIAFFYCKGGEGAS
jgi:hypothetical protein